MKWAECEKALVDKFTVNDLVGGNLSEVFAAEKASEQCILQNYHPLSVVIDSFQSLYIEALKKAFEWIAGNGWPTGCEHYAPVFFDYLTAFRRFRACMILFYGGYPLDAYAHLRDLKDRAILLAGIAHNITTFARVWGFDGTGDENPLVWQQMKNDRKEEEKKVFRRIIGKESGLPAPITQKLAKWQDMFNTEMHGGRLTWTTELSAWVRGEKPLSIGPTPMLEQTRNFATPVTQVAWLLMRLFPHFQPAPNTFGLKWREKYKVLDAAFRCLQEDALKADGGTFGAIIHLVDEKFSFPESFCYFEADGSG